MDAPGRLWPWIVEAAATVGDRDFKGLHTLAEATGERFRRGIALYTGRTGVPFGNDLFALPWAPCGKQPVSV